jgi:hypothetical protein
VLVGAVTLAAVVSSNRPAAREAASARTGEINDMGLPVVETPGSATGKSVAAGVEVAEADWSLGEVPLDTAVRPSWTLRNTGDEPVTFGEPHPEVREGCCPGPFALESPTLAAGESTTLTFELAMHAGMDGWHDIAVHVPVTTEGSDSEILTLGVTGDFR